MRCARAAAIAGLLAACGPDTNEQDPSSSTSATTSDGGTDDATSTGAADTGVDPQCQPWPEVELGWERDGDDALPAVGGIARVAIMPEGGVVVATTDETEEDEDVVVALVDWSGDAAWSLRYEGMAGLTDEALDVEVAPDGSVYVVVREQTKELISEGFGSRYERTIAVLAIEPSGARRWRYERVVPPPQYNDNARAAGLAVTDDGHVIVVDGDATSEDIAPPRLLELDRFGNAIVDAELDVALAEVQVLDVDASATDAVYVVAVRYGGSWIARLQRDGTIVWVDDGDPGNVIAMSVAAGDDDAAYVLARTGDEEAGDAGFELRRYDAEGSVAWTSGDAWPTGSGSPAAVVVDCDGAPLVVGEVSEADDRHGWVGRFSPQGDLSWSTTLESVRAIAPRSAALGSGGFFVGGLEGGDALGPWIARLE